MKKNKMKIGYGFFCSTSDNRLSTNHRFMLKNLNKETLFKTVERNINDLIKLLELSQNLGCSIFRLGSNFIPFFSHLQFKDEWKRKLELMIKKISPKVKSFKLRITMPPGQFVVLNSENHSVVENSLKELAYHFWLLDQLGLDNNGVVVVHLGKVGEDKKLSMERFINTVNKNLWLK